MMRLVRLSLIFYKGRGRAVDKIIRFWTKSIISHSEIETIGGYFCSNDPVTRVMRFARIEPRADEWERCFIVLPLEVAKKLHLYQQKKCGSRYDWEGILFSQLFKLGYSAKNRWFCSKSNLDDIQMAVKIMRSENTNSRYDKLLDAYEPILKVAPHTVSPAKLYSLIKECEERLRGYNLLD